MGADIRARVRVKMRKKPSRKPTGQAYAWSIRMEGNGGPAQPAPTIAQCLNGGLGWLEVQCNRCKNSSKPSA